ncbi:MAG: NAD(P)/FAD-dependent oxidoreductase [Nannocystaceae bacterium]
MSAPEQYDVAVVGGGPAGACMAACLARASVRVVVVERERFPRFHIGESLLPSCLPPLQRMGVALDGGEHVLKRGAAFFDERTGEHNYFGFDEALPGLPEFAYQVDRAVFDRALLDAARRAGAAVHEGTSVLDHHIDDGGVTLTLAPTPAGPGPDECLRGASRPAPERGAATSLRARYLVDASGRRGVSSRGGRELRSIAGLGRVASFLHYAELGDAAWAELLERGEVRVLRIDDGWIWLIPLFDRRLSVGVVSRRQRLPDDELHATLAASPMLTRLTQGASVTGVRHVGEYSYANLAARGPRYVAIGDAAGFLDPVFSSGVAIALMSAERAAQTLLPVLHDPQALADPDLMAPLSEATAVAYRSFHTIAHRFYNGRLIDNLLLASAPDQRMRAGLVSLLAGDVWRDDNRFQSAVLSATRHELPPTPWSSAS